MNRVLIVLTVALVLAPILSLILGESPVVDLRPGDPAPPRTVLGPSRRAVPVAPSAAPTTEEPTDSTRPAAPSAPVFRMAEEDRLFEEGARRAWKYVNSQYNERTGLANSVARYPYATVWDVASSLAALYCARELGLLSADDFTRRMGRALRTLRTLPLFDRAVFNKNYQVARGVPAGPDDRARPPRRDGFGWSAVDVGRLLIWLKIIATSHPELADEVTAVANRLDFDRLISDGYLHGEAIGRRGRTQRYQEGRFGYEQYAAAGFAVWGKYADRALSWEENARPVEVLDVPLLTDKRGGAHLTGEPFFLIGLEIGWLDPSARDLAQRIIAVQEERFVRTKQLTMVSEDALPVPPHYFYYYTLHDEGEPFAVRALGPNVPKPAPRWVSTKAAFAWYALMPGPYTWRVLEDVAAKARHPTLGWSAGVYERTGKPTGSPNINTAAVILEAALYHARGRPLLPLSTDAP